jgi:hypothetical protein
MRILSKGLFIAVGMLAIGLVSSSVSANNLLVGSFTLDHPTQWKNTTLPAGNYTLKLARTETDTNVLKIQGKTQTLEIMMFAQYACTTCKNGALNLDVAGDNRVVTALDLPGFHVDFTPGRLSAEKERQSAKTKPAARTEQVAVQVNPN